METESKKKKTIFSFVHSDWWGRIAVFLYFVFPWIAMRIFEEWVGRLIGSTLAFLVVVITFILQVLDTSKLLVGYKVLRDFSPKAQRRFDIIARVMCVVVAIVCWQFVLFPLLQTCSDIVLKGERPEVATCVIKVDSGTAGGLFWIGQAGIAIQRDDKEEVDEDYVFFFGGSKYLKVGKRYELYFSPKRKFILAAKRVEDTPPVPRVLPSDGVKSYYEEWERTNRACRVKHMSNSTPNGVRP